MSITLQRIQFGDYTMYKLGNSSSYIEFIPARSGYIHQVCLAQHNLLWNYPDAGALQQNSGHRNLALLPFPNRLLEGEYSWQGKDLKFEVNKPDTRSALHGFGPHAAFELERVDYKGNVASVEMSYLHRSGDHPQSYPFDVLFKLQLSLDVQRPAASWTLSANNLMSTDIPVGLGWHPYFLLPGGLDNWSVNMPPNQKVVMHNAIPTGELKTGLPHNQQVAIDTSWDDCFLLDDKAQREIKLQGPAYQLSLKQENSTNYTQLYVPPVQTAVAIEPMSCGVNAFQASQQEVTLSPQRGVAIGMTVSLKA